MLAHGNSAWSISQLFTFSSSWPCRLTLPCLYMSYNCALYIYWKGGLIFPFPLSHCTVCPQGLGINVNMVSLTSWVLLSFSILHCPKFPPREATTHVKSWFPIPWKHTSFTGSIRNFQSFPKQSNTSSDWHSSLLLQINKSEWKNKKMEISEFFLGNNVLGLVWCFMMHQRH